jgi:hypothetical protein
MDQPVLVAWGRPEESGWWSQVVRVESGWEFQDVIADIWSGGVSDHYYRPVWAITECLRAPLKGIEVGEHLSPTRPRRAHRGLHRQWLCGDDSWALDLHSCALGQALGALTGFPVASNPVAQGALVDPEIPGHRSERGVRAILQLHGGTSREI